jgi:hypothetical protein
MAGVNDETEWSYKNGIPSVLTQQIELLNRVFLAISVLWPQLLWLNLSTELCASHLV